MAGGDELRAVDAPVGPRGLVPGVDLGGALSVGHRHQAAMIKSVRAAPTREIGAGHDVGEAGLGGAEDGNAERKGQDRGESHLPADSSGCGAFPPCMKNPASGGVCSHRWPGLRDRPEPGPRRH